MHDAPWWTLGVDAMASAICHRLPERSFHTAGTQWPREAMWAQIAAARRAGGCRTD
jgi:hypothetical protein